MSQAMSDHSNHLSTTLSGSDPGGTTGMIERAPLVADMAAMLAQLRETIGNLDAVLAAVHEPAD